MRMVDIITSKRNGNELTDDEISFFVKGYTEGEIPDYQVSALMMAIYFRGMNERETLTLTKVMEDSGDKLDLSGINGIKVDKHSTGGVGDKTSLALTPIVSACGVPIAKMSGRGLGHTGGTIDKLESFDGFNVSISTEEFVRNVNEVGISIMGQTADLAPADKKLYALRDVTGTVENMSLIASSIMSKKLAAGADAIVLDVKTGSGAFMKTLEDSRALAEEMVRIGKGAGRKTVALISDMDQPLGNTVGNAIEVREAIETLMGKGPDDFTELVYALATQMLILGEKASGEEEALAMIKEAVSSGRALDRLAAFVKVQGGDPEQVYHPEKLKVSDKTYTVKAENSGYIEHIVCDEVGIACMMLGGGRASKEDVIDLSVGIRLLKKTGDEVAAGDDLAIIYYTDDANLENAANKLRTSYVITDRKTEKGNLIKDLIK
ncbi:MAG: pyrimidine-nucleoside phosphorylase [Lachnospiraceae bacterium]|nr:pyrimidine-nucleoside phosphorylase [Lachnospiraceae bacterium]